jgi:hypothetical protein
MDLTAGLDKESRRVEEKQSDVQEVEDGLDSDQRRRAALEATHSHVDRAGTHTDRELLARSAVTILAAAENTYSLPRPAMDATREVGDRSAGDDHLGREGRL